MSGLKPVTPSDLKQYLDEDPKKMMSNGKEGYVFEALCEMIVNNNPKYGKLSNIADRYEKNNEFDDPREYLSGQFDTLVHEETKEIITIKQKEKWIEHSLQGFVDFGVSDPEVL